MGHSPPQPMAFRLALLAGLLLFASAATASAAGWPAYRADAGRTGYTAEELPAGPVLLWTHRPAHPPSPAWPDEPRMTFDHAFHVVSDGKSVYFGSSADGKVYALDAATGRERWSFFTAGPVRFAPVLWEDRVLAASDDGFLYCLRTADGTLAWKSRPAPSGRMVLGNGRMISKWPARGGPVVVGDTVYFGAGIWPTEGVWLCALKAADGSPVWTNSEAGRLSMAQPHGAGAKSGVSIQGYLAVAGDRVLSPAGRAPYACFDRAGGKLLYHHLGIGWSYGAFGPTAGGSTVAAVDGVVFHGSLYVCQLADGKGVRLRESGLCADTLAAAPQRIYFWNGKALVGLDRAGPLRPGAKGDGKKEPADELNEVWRIDLEAGPRECLIVAGGTALLGGHGSVQAVDLAGKKPAWSVKVEGAALGLAVAGGRLLVSTDRGHIACFGAGGSGAGGDAPAAQPTAVRIPDQGGEFAAVAEEIVKLGGVTGGWCLDLGCGDGRLALELARRTRLNIVGLEKDPARVALARQRLDAAGFLGARVTVLQGDPEKTELPNFFADLGVSATGVAGGEVPEGEALRCLRPFGGVALFGRPGGMKKTVRGPLEGAGSWTHQYADAGNSSCSGDGLLRSPLTVLWFGAPGQKMPSRHGRPPAPLVAGGLMIIQGLEEVSAVSAYNGQTVWTKPLEGIGRPWDSEPKVAGVAASGSSICTDGSAVYVANGGRCLRLDLATGRMLGEFKVPAGEAGETAEWGYLACADGLLLGSRALPRSKREQYSSASGSLFALDSRTGALKWSRRAAHAIRHSAVAVGGGRVFLIDRPLPEANGGSAKDGKPPAHPLGTLLALDAATGKPAWSCGEDVFGTVLVLDAKSQTLLMAYQASHYLGLSEDLGGRFAAFRAEDGRLLHDTAAKYETRPVIVGGTVHGGTGAWELATGKPVESLAFRRSYGCGVLSAGERLLAFRSGCIGYFDMHAKAGVESFGGVRPSCWLNLVPAGGLLLAPEYTAGCGCSYQMKASLALEPAGPAPGR